MKLHYISHSCFVIESNGTRLVFDPWITPTAYDGLWLLHPKPIDINPATQADVVLISHGHDDHLNSESLKLINKDAHIFFPFHWREGIEGYLKHLGFSKVTEAVSFRKYRYNDIDITYLGYAMESVIVVECENRVLVNINDALNSNHETAVQFLLDAIQTRWGKIDFLLSGWSGAGYFPNKVHFNGKDDLEVARIREQYFANNFCKFTKFLNPAIAIAFAPGFVLLQNENRWINEIKFPREVLNDYYKQHFDPLTKIKFPIAFPGDYFEDTKFIRASPYHEQSEEKMYRNLDAEFSEEIELTNRTAWADDEMLETLMTNLKYWLNKNSALYHPRVIEETVFSIRLTDVFKNNWIHISFEGSTPIVRRNDSPSTNDKLHITTNARILSMNFSKPWGGDLLSIGYAIDVTVFEESSLEKNLDIVCVRLISRFPNARDDFKYHLSRMAKYYLSSPDIAGLWLKQKIKLRPYVNKFPFNERDHWLTYRKCDLCKVCNMPEYEFMSEQE